MKQQGTTSDRIALTTDFGVKDHYVAAMKGVIASLAPDARVIDVTHEVPPQDVTHGAFVLNEVWDYLPAGTIHVAVVDPGVGSVRRIVAAAYDGRMIVAPDNGLLTFLQRTRKLEWLFVVENRRLFLPNPSSTFHGRDIMAPVAAQLANGLRPQEVGRMTDSLEILPVRHRAEFTGTALRGEGLVADHFGNIVTNVAADQLHGMPARCEVFVNGQSVGPVRRTFSDVPEGQAAAVIGSGGRVEIVCNRGSARARFGEPRDLSIEIKVPDGKLPGSMAPES